MTTIRRLKQDGPSLFRAPVPAAPRPKNVQLMKLVLILLAFLALLSVAMPSFAQSAPAAFERFQKTPTKKTTKIGGAR